MKQALFGQKALQIPSAIRAIPGDLFITRIVAPNAPEATILCLVRLDDC